MDFVIAPGTTCPANCLANTLTLCAFNNPAENNAAITTSGFNGCSYTADTTSALS